jgi:hypothetical protein
MNFRQQFDRWLLGSARAVIHGGAVALSTAFTISTANAIGLPVDQLSLKQLGAVWLGGALYALNKYLAAIPLPDPQEQSTATSKSTS